MSFNVLHAREANQSKVNTGAAFSRWLWEAERLGGALVLPWPITAGQPLTLVTILTGHSMLWPLCLGWA